MNMAWSVGASISNSFVPIFTARDVARRDEPLAAPVGVKVRPTGLVSGGATPRGPLGGATLSTKAVLWVKSSTGSVSSMFVCKVSSSVTTLLNSTIVKFVDGTTVLMNGAWFVSGIMVVTVWALAAHSPQHTTAVARFFFITPLTNARMERVS